MVTGNEIDWYYVLGVNRMSTSEEVTKAYRKLALKWNPNEKSPNSKVKAEAMFKYVDRAYNVLNDPDKRRQYDEHSSALLKLPPTVKVVSCSLEEFYLGSQLSVIVGRVIVCPSGTVIKKSETFTVKIEPGCKDGTIFTHSEMGNKKPGMVPGDVEISIIQKPHAIYKRFGNDLVVFQSIPLVDALTGTTI